ncbi:MAG: hypothetical protein JRF63_02660 [Deltaproteobacteria bacterium]|nr:hypothetical protein [Deltaproteobacteria bacterium]
MISIEHTTDESEHVQLTRRSSPTAAFLVLFVFVSTLVPTAVSAEVELDEQGASLTSETSFEPASPPEQWQPPWRGSYLGYRNAVSATSLDRGAELTYNPYYAMGLFIAPRWWLGDALQISADLTVMRELTDADTTSEQGETLLGDLVVGLSAPSFYTVPAIELELSAGLDLITPTSKGAQARTLYVGLTPGVGLARRFDVLAGLAFSYGFGATKFFHGATTAQREAPLIPDCSASGSCELYVGTGMRNTSWRLQSSFGASLSFVDWLSISAGVAVLTDVLYPLDGTDSQVSYEPQEPTDLRHTMAYSAEILGWPMPSLGIALGAETVNPQLRPDSTNEQPFFNRYTVLYLDLRLDFAGLSTQIASGRKGKR